MDVILKPMRTILNLTVIISNNYLRYKIFLLLSNVFLSLSVVTHYVGPLFSPFIFIKDKGIKLLKSKSYSFTSVFSVKPNSSALRTTRL